MSSGNRKGKKMLKDGLTELIEVVSASNHENTYATLAKQVVSAGYKPTIVIFQTINLIKEITPTTWCDNRVNVLKDQHAG